GAARAIAVPEGHLARFAGGGPDKDAIVGDLRDPPGRGAEEEDVAHARLEDHLLVELANPAAPGGSFAVHKVDTVQPSIRDGTTVDNSDPSSALPRAHPALVPVPRDPRAELGELVRGVAAREHVEDALERASGQIRERGSAAHERIEGIDLDLFHGGDRDD